MSAMILPIQEKGKGFFNAKAQRNQGVAPSCLREDVGTRSFLY